MDNAAVILLQMENGLCLLFVKKIKHPNLTKNWSSISVKNT